MSVRGETFVELAWMDAPGCGGSEIAPRLSTGGPREESVWESLQAVGVAPPGAASAEVIAWFRSASPDGFQAYIDDVRVLELPETAASVQQLVVLAALGALARRRRR
jgi:hypothetical protein